jgi:hypothetical protein
MILKIREFLDNINTDHMKNPGISPIVLNKVFSAFNYRGSYPAD